MSAISKLDITRTSYHVRTALLGGRRLHPAPTWRPVVPKDRPTLETSLGGPLGCDIRRRRPEPALCKSSVRGWQAGGSLTAELRGWHCPGKCGGAWLGPESPGQPQGAALLTPAAGRALHLHLWPWRPPCRHNHDLC